MYDPTCQVILWGNQVAVFSLWKDSATNRMFVFPQNSYIETLIPKVLVFGRGVWEIIRSYSWSPHDGITTYKETIYAYFSLSFPPLSLPGENTETRRWPSAGRMKTITRTWAWTLQPLEISEIDFCCLSHLVCGNLLQHSKMPQFRLLPL